MNARLRRTQEFLSGPRATTVILLVSVALTSVTLTLGRTLDDYLQQVMMRDEPNLAGLPHHGLDLFAFVQTPSDVIGLANEGVFQWYSDPTAKIALFRPLAALTHWLDEALWPNSLFMMHLQNLVWFGLLLWVVAQLFRALESRAWIAALAFALYALDDARATPVGWLCNRNGLMAPAFAFASFWLYVRSRRGDGAARVLGPISLGLGLFSGEAAVQVIGYFAAYSFVLDDAKLKDRMLSLLPYALMTIAWRAVYVGLHFGTHDSGLYLDPADVPLAYLQGLALRMPLLMLAEFAFPYGDLWDLFPVLLPIMQPLTLALAALILPTLFVLFRPLWSDRHVRFWVIGMILATLPACGAPTNDRLLMATSLGGANLLARFFAEVLEGRYPRGERRFVQHGMAALAFIHLVAAPLSLPARTLAASALEEPLNRADRSIPTDPAITEQSVIVINPAFDTFGCFFQVYRAARNTPRPKHFRWLASGAYDIQVSRLDENTLRVRPDKGFLASDLERMARSKQRPIALGEQFDRQDAVFTVASLTDDGRPLEVDVRFTEPLESERYRWYQWGTLDYVPFRVPKLGESVIVPAVNVARVLAGQ